MFYYYERYKMDEIANLIGISLNTVKSRLRRSFHIFYKTPYYFLYKS
ncbi:sigma factor-like helix-turn-helix DNA-binding protein [Bacillus sp. E(2018)]